MTERVKIIERHVNHVHVTHILSNIRKKMFKMQVEDYSNICNNVTLCNLFSISKFNK